LILEGILLHTAGFAALQSWFDIKILLRASFAEAQRRREARGGYVTQEGFWEDPEGYFEEVVWRSYREGHERFFHDGDVEGEVRREEGMAVDGAEKKRKKKKKDEKKNKTESYYNDDDDKKQCMVNDVWVQPLGMDIAEGLEWVWGILEKSLLMRMEMDAHGDEAKVEAGIEGEGEDENTDEVEVDNGKTEAQEVTATSTPTASSLGPGSGKRRDDG
jgi:hypothetical protein